eukprot:CAMPEP_0172602822 /NCGR_PEP_ID=MMETSP1068-20121228/23004_1 /TAXON_ID=35684 /ORGANISM="Pseudopedinella elastica, Strain CCMP716" /LENGTH=146 /DNA_ID=CAMNT_0013404319 /DNA_START=23 /DNA_END=460 /DNA_ORIENTATION=+
MGVGLIPFIAILGGAAAVGGGSVAYHASQPVDTRLVLASKTLDEARRWKVGLEAAVASREGRRPPPVGLSSRRHGVRLLKAWNDPRACTWATQGLIHGLRLLTCLPRPNGPLLAAEAAAAPSRAGPPAAQPYGEAGPPGAAGAAAA